MRDFRKYDVWQLSHAFVLRIYQTTASFPKSEQYGIVRQLCRAALSVPTNFCEGCGRDSNAEFQRFIQIAIGSAHEVEYLILLSRDLKFISSKVHDGLHGDINLIKQKLFHLAKKLKA